MSEMEAAEVVDDVVIEEDLGDEVEDFEEGDEDYDGEEESAEGEDLSSEEVEEVAEAIEDGASEEEVKELIETFKFKANGKDKEVTLDWNNKEDIIRRLQLAEAAQPAMQKASETEKNFMEALEELKNDPWAVLKEIGHNPDELAEAYIQDKINQMKKSPDEVARDEMEKELNGLREKLKKEEEAKHEADKSRLMKEAEVELETQIMAAIDATTSLPKAPYVVKRIADSMLYAMDNGYPDVTAEQVIPSVEKEINREYQEMVENMPDKVLESFVGKKALDRLRKNRIAKHKAPKNAKVGEVKRPAAEKKEEKKKMSIKDFMSRNLAK